MNLLLKSMCLLRDTLYEKSAF